MFQTLGKGHNSFESNVQELGPNYTMSLNL